VTIDLSYLALAEALPQIDRAVLADHASVLALVKPTYELRAATLAADRSSVTGAIERVSSAMARLGWSVARIVPSPITGSRGANEVFVHAVVPRLSTD
jgi:predicted rRNA methylase YqxC with S4 and FtsJ domains